MESSEKREMPKNNMALAIVGTILGCCSPYCLGLILGIVAIVMSTQVKNKFEEGDFEGAEKSAKNAKILAFISIGLFITLLIMIGLKWDEFIEAYYIEMEKYQ
jgi:Ca2+/Na+ antiporter